LGTHISATIWSEEELLTALAVAAYHNCSTNLSLLRFPRILVPALALGASMTLFVARVTPILVA
jgi:hypothetical protein